MSSHSAAAPSQPSPAPAEDGITAKVMQALRQIRASAADGSAYDATTPLTDAGFTSMEMVKIMLAVEAAFDLTIPPEHITPANFATGHAIAAMLRQLLPAG